MSNSMTLNVRIGSSLTDYINQNIGEEGDYDNVSEYIRDLVRQDKSKKEALDFQRLKAELQLAYHYPESDYIELTAKDVINRNNIENHNE